MIINPKTDGNEHLLSEAYSEDDGELETQGVRFAKVDGQEFRLEAVDPYALWKIKPKSGHLPESLSGAYTSPSEAEQAIKAYLLAERFKEQLKSTKEASEKHGSPTNTQSKSISDKPGSKSS